MTKLRLTVGEWKNIVHACQDMFCEMLGASYDINALEPLQVKAWNALFLGHGGDSNVCVKVFNEETTGVRRSRSHLRYAVKAMAGFPRLRNGHVIRPLPSPAGIYIHRCGKYWCLVFPWSDAAAHLALNDAGPQQPETISRAAHILALLHRRGRPVAAELGSRERAEVPYALSPGCWANQLDRIRKSSQQIILARGCSQEARECIEEGYALCREFVNQQQAFIAYDPRRDILVHGDFRPGNMAIIKDRFVVWDFDCTHVAGAESDVAYAALSFGGPRWFHGSRCWNCVNAFVDEYRKYVRGPFSINRCRIAIEWQVLKVMSLSFDEDQLHERLRLYRECKKQLSDSSFCQRSAKTQEEI